MMYGGMYGKGMYGKGMYGNYGGQQQNSALGLTTLAALDLFRDLNLDDSYLGRSILGGAGMAWIFDLEGNVWSFSFYFRF